MTSADSAAPSTGIVSWTSDRMPPAELFEPPPRVTK
jgi:hypothetical protein